jgi:hypothetical protein
MKKLFCVLAIAGVLMFSVPAMAFFINFENGTDGATVTNIGGVSFMNFGGYPPMYGDSRTGAYNTTSDDLGYVKGFGNYHHMGNFFIWAGDAADARGVKIDFTNNDGTWFKTGYSSYSIFVVEAWLTDGTMISVTGDANIDGPMGYLMIAAPDGKAIDYIVLHDTGNYWLADDMSGDASGVTTNAVPEPATMLLLGFGLAGVAVARKRFRK